MSALLGVIMASILMVVLTPHLAGLVQQNQDRATVADTAGEFQDLLRATEKYVQNHQSDLAASIPVGSSASLALSTLSSSGSGLISGFPLVSPFGQGWTIWLSQPAPGEIHGVVVSTGGKALSLYQLTSIASLAGSRAGFVPADNALPGLSSRTAMGASGGWKLPLAGQNNPGAGHLYGQATVAQGTIYNSDALYRSAVPNHPELNTMATKLDMGGNSIGDANNIQAQSGTFSIADFDGFTPAGRPGSVKIGGTYLYGDNNNFAVRQNGYFAVQHPDGSGANMTANEGFFTGNIGTSGFSSSVGLPAGWSGGIHTWDGYFEGSIGVGNGGQHQSYMGHDGYASFDKGVHVGTAEGASSGNACPTNGEISQQTDGSGVILHCENNVWSGNNSFTHVSSISIATNHWYANTSSGALFVSSMCADTPFANGFVESVDATIADSSGRTYHAAHSRIQEGGSDSQFGAAPFVSFMVPPHGTFVLSTARTDNQNFCDATLVN